MNTIIKNDIMLKFNKSYKTYDKYCFVQNEICKKAIKLLLKYKYESHYIVDFGCGTGESIKQLIKHVKYGKCYAVDFSENLLQVAKMKLPSEIIFIVSDFDSPLLRSAQGYFDLVFSNMALQWSCNFSKTLQLFNEYLLKNGIVVFSIPINNNFPEIIEDYKLRVSSHVDIIKALDVANFELMEHCFEKIIELFSNQTEALKSLKYVGANYNKSQNRKHGIGLSKINTHDMFINSHLSQLTYEIGIYLAKKR